jgi:vancomycin resistance protein VanW
MREPAVASHMRSRNDSSVAGAGATLLCALLLLIGGGLAIRFASAPAPEVEIVGFSTSLNGRTSSQRHNARLAAESLNEQVIPPGAVFSFNKTVKSWSADRGYVKAPVSYDGELVKAYGGGLCQTSTTLYNAALLAALPIVERHPHVFAPRYIAPGQDAAVAYPSIDLRFLNPFPWPLRIRARVYGDRLEVRLFGRERPNATARIVTQVVETQHPEKRTRVIVKPKGSAGRAYLRSPGLNGYRVVTYRVISENGREVRRERLSDDTYPAMNRVIALTEEETARE